LFKSKNCLNSKPKFVQIWKIFKTKIFSCLNFVQNWNLFKSENFSNFENSSDLEFLKFKIVFQTEKFILKTKIHTQTSESGKNKTAKNNEKRKRKQKKGPSANGPRPICLLSRSEYRICPLLTLVSLHVQRTIYNIQINIF
jgi:hypothetical protein